jgi:hypothetical protein
MTSTAVKLLVIEPIITWVSSCAGVGGSSRARPTWLDQASSPSRATPTDSPGVRQLR